MPADARRLVRRAANGLAVALLVAACGTAASPSPTDAPATTPAGSAPASASPSAAPTAPPPTTTTGTADPLAIALVAALASDPLIVHVDQDAKVTTTGPSGVTVTITMSADLSGLDMSMRLSGDQAGQTFDTELVVVGDTAYVRQDAGEWGTAPRATVATQLDNLLMAIRFVSDPGTLRDMGPETVDGRSLHRLTANGTIPYLPATGGTGQYDVFDIWTLDDGTPVLARTAFSATDAAGNSATGTTEFRFSKFGGPITITAPEVVPAG